MIVFGGSILRFSEKGKKYKQIKQMHELATKIKLHVYNTQIKIPKALTCLSWVFLFEFSNFIGFSGQIEKDIRKADNKQNCRKLAKRDKIKIV